jgi:tripartite-type tricarboxylate transporter receptor subunit TctC
MHTYSRRTVLFGAGALALLPGTGWAQEQVIKVIYPFPAGGTADSIARLIAHHMQQDMHKSVIVENKPGAGGRIGARLVKVGPVDGTMLMFAVSSQLMLQPHLFSDLGYDPFGDFTPVSQVMTFDQALAVPANSPIRSVGELVAWYRANPEQAIFGSPGTGTGPHVVGLEFARTFHLKLRHVAYRGTAAALPDLFTGRIPAYFAASAELIEQQTSGKLRILAIGGVQRSQALPDVPTFNESGADIDASGWYAVYAPAQTSAAIVNRLEKEIIAIAHNPEVRSRIVAMGFQPTGTTADELGKIQRSDFDHWAHVVSETDLKGSQ